ncbi:hypothetical protein PHSY_001600 [Pseudozyma hubeiensis SY62]|uniref:Uncharacterized protein n=1 Tax=Pseudozyma hubeiensis (strain SY62) TaxID=1305764 RepID=R9NZ66_PSEHS|nr:hypothetical protein PHSY_001600 [Pseudozyma hubeiensis SY62]GAC94031.1 hypothetical protein PHSY_001600 [Pseudozyma hubeiensis SY62]
MPISLAQTDRLIDSQIRQPPNIVWSQHIVDRYRTLIAMWLSPMESDVVGRPLSMNVLHNSVACLRFDVSRRRLFSAEIDKADEQRHSLQRHICLGH